MGKKGMLSFDTIWADLDCIMLSAVSQRKTNTVRYRFYGESKKAKLRKTQ